MKQFGKPDRMGGQCPLIDEDEVEFMPVKKLFGLLPRPRFKKEALGLMGLEQRSNLCSKMSRFIDVEDSE